MCIVKRQGQKNSMLASFKVLMAIGTINFWDVVC
jgi:hypothetical protein